MENERDRLKKIIEQESQRLDNQTVFGGFHQYMKRMIQKHAISIPEELFLSIDKYPHLTKCDKSIFLKKIATSIMSHSNSQPVSPLSPSPIKPVDFRLSIRTLKGVGPVVEKQLNRLNIYTIEDLIFYFPRYYQDRGQIITIAKAGGSILQTVLGKVVRHDRVSTRRGQLLKIVVQDQTGQVSLVCFHRNFLAQILSLGKKVLITGFFQTSYGKKETSRFEYELIDSEDFQFEPILPVFSLTEGLPPKKLRSLIDFVLKVSLSALQDTIPPGIREKYHLQRKSEAILELHHPVRSSVSELNRHCSRSHIALIFEEFLLFALSLKVRKHQIQSWRVQPIVPNLTFIHHFVQQLPFELTLAQKRVIKQLEKDLTSGKVMNRLLQGDVGSGKTLVAIIGALYVIKAGQQVAMMAPTEILAHQHYLRWGQILKRFGIEVGLVIGGQKKGKNELVEKIEQGQIDFVIGTHALLEDYVQFNQLGLVIVDEQHRFGVKQRSQLKGKAVVPHLLVMSATPIPRTLALTLYGDLDVSILDEKPIGRKPVETVAFSMKDQNQAFLRVHSFLERGQQAFVVCPAIEESDLELSNVYDVYQQLKNKWFPHSPVELIHGKLPSKEKDDIMGRFSRGEIQILVSTSVIEVGIDVPNANVMIIENAERFGLAQLHQLRGRIGRGDQTGLCVLLYQGKNQDIQKRMEIMINTDDGFQIAEEDLKMRGPGEFYGVKQSGILEFHLADPFRDWVILEKAYQEADLILQKDPQLQKPENQLLRKEIERRFFQFLPDEFIIDA
ncbi:MAG: ATP-dependent DNA helicase RecG [Candidatus Atribacteria bacterium]|nr:ATP-dependent DNA helicase RecG [Candidatus Atribacteria bacterium]